MSGRAGPSGQSQVQGSPVQIPDPPGDTLGPVGAGVGIGGITQPTPANALQTVTGLLSQPSVPTSAVGTILALIAMLVNSSYGGLQAEDAKLRADLGVLQAKIITLESTQVTRADLDALRSAIRDLELAVDGRVRSVELEQARGERRKGGGD